MNANFGEKLIDRCKSKSKIIITKIISGLVGIATLVIGLNMLFGWVDFFGNEAGFTPSILLALVFFVFTVIAVLVFFFTGPESAAVYEEGLVLTDGSKEHRIPFDQIKGLEDTDTSTTFTSLSGGLVGAVISTAVTAAASSIAASNRAANRKRGITVVLKDGKQHGVLDAVGQDLSESYTKWLLKDIDEKNITELDMCFGKELVLKDGYLICTETFTNGGTDAKVHINDITHLSYESSETLHFMGRNDKGKEKALMKVKSVYNIDVLVHLLNAVSKTAEA